MRRPQSMSTQQVQQPSQAKAGRLLQEERRKMLRYILFNAVRG